MIKKIRFYYLLSTAFLRRNLRSLLRWAVLALIIFVFARLTFTGFWKPLFNKAYLSLSKTTYTEGLVGSVNSLNPLLETTEAEKQINHIIFRGLTKVDSEGNIKPDLAESYEIKNNLEYTFHLRHDVHWDDGVTFTADDVVSTVEESQDVNFPSTARNVFKDVKVEKLDDFTVRFTLKETFAPFLFQTTLGIIPKHVSLKSYRPVGTGIFHLTSFSTKKVVITDGKIDLVFKIYPTIDQALTALKMGEIKALGGLDNSQIEGLKKWKNYRVYSENIPNRLVAVFFNTKADTVSDKVVRQSLGYATDKDALMRLASHGSVKASGPLPERNYLKLNTVERLEFNLKKASSLLDFAGWKLVNHKRVKDGKRLSLTITVPEDPELISVADKIGENWTKLGADFQTIKLSNTEFADVVKRTQFQIALTTEEVSSDPDQYVLWHSTQVGQGNITAITSEKIDKLLEDARKTVDSKERKSIYLEFVRILEDESPAIFLYYPGYDWAVNKKFGNIDLRNFYFPADRFDTAQSWKIPRFSI